MQNKGEGCMYGLLLESVQFHVIQKVGEDVWDKILQNAGFKNIQFTTHETYKDEMMTLLAKSCCQVTKSRDFQQWMQFFGKCFVDFCSTYGYDKLLKVAGRNYRDFLHGIDNIHEVIRFSYPRLRSPSFMVLTEDEGGCVLLYQSIRQGFKHYVIGQLQQIAKRFYNVHVKIIAIDEEIIERKCHVKFRLDFDNSAYKTNIQQNLTAGKQEFSKIQGTTFFKVGDSIAALLGDDNLIGCFLKDKFYIRRPLIKCIWNMFLQFQRVIFELEYIISDIKDEDVNDKTSIRRRRTISDSNERILLRGQMKFIEEWDMIAFLCTPLLNSLNDLQAVGLFINDLNTFDMSRDMVMAGWQHASQLERSIEQQKVKGEKISEYMTQIEEWKKRSDELLYSMIPKSVAERLKSGVNAIDTCEVADNVTIMFNYMVGFGDVCSTASPMEIVRIINSFFSLFDQIVDKYGVFKVETLGDAVYMVASGVPDRNPNHAIDVAGVALELQEKAKNQTESWNQTYKLNTRIGMHTGNVVGGVIGRRMPQYCLFGDTVNTASRMETYSLPGRIHISEPCQQCLKGSSFVTVVRGTVNVKGKGEMRTFWLAGREGDENAKKFCEEVKSERNQVVRKYSSYENPLDLHGMHTSTSFAQMPASFLTLKNNQSSSNIDLPKLEHTEEEDVDLGDSVSIQSAIVNHDPHTLYCKSERHLDIPKATARTKAKSLAQQELVYDITSSEVIMNNIGSEKRISVFIGSDEDIVDSRSSSDQDNDAVNSHHNLDILNGSSSNVYALSSYLLPCRDAETPD